tara:strand:- start:47 stop:334 length:288 start_codon:yes stop_codon:yes gene_type:complete
MNKKIKEIIEALEFMGKMGDVSKIAVDNLKTGLEELDEQLTLTDVVNCNCDESKQLEEEFEINHLINDTYQVVGKDSSTVWKQGTMEECNDWVML